MLILDRAVFLHVPKTGGTWVKAALWTAGARFEELTVDGDIHGDLSYSPHPERFTFAFVRHPLHVYQSYWRYKIGAGWDANNPLDCDCRADTFHEFVALSLDRAPGWCSRLFEDYVGRPGHDISFIGRYERLADDLVRALTLAGEPFDEAALRGLAPRNVSQVPLALASWTPALAARVAVAERDAMLRFGYRLDQI